MMEKMIKCAFYGSLRKPMYNYIRFIQTFGQNSMLYRKTVRIPGYELYNLGPYPAIKNAELDKSIVVDLFEVSNEAYESIVDMEVGAGYYEDEVEFENNIYKLFPFSLKTREDQIIASGDWIKYSMETGNYKTKENEHANH